MLTVFRALFSIRTGSATRRHCLLPLLTSFPIAARLLSHTTALKINATIAFAQLPC